MALVNTFEKVTGTIFKVFSSLAKDANYVQITNSGWSEDISPVETLYPISVIFDTFSQRDVQSLPFSKLLQPTDIKGLVPGSSVPPIISTEDRIRIVENSSEYHIVAWVTDPAKALYTFLLREV